jgi:hypothetical protein
MPPSRMRPRPGCAFFPHGRPSITRRTLFTHDTGYLPQGVHRFRDFRGAHGLVRPDEVVFIKLELADLIFELQQRFA